MTRPLKLLSLQETFSAVAKVRARVEDCEAQSLDPIRALDGTSGNALLSMVVLVGQLDRIAQAAAGACAAPGQAAELSALAALDELLEAAGYLPLPNPTPDTQQKEPAHGEG